MGSSRSWPVHQERQQAMGKGAGIRTGLLPQLPVGQTPCQQPYCVCVWGGERQPPESGTQARAVAVSLASLRSEVSSPGHWPRILTPVPPAPGWLSLTRKKGLCNSGTCANECAWMPVCVCKHTHTHTHTHQPTQTEQPGRVGPAFPGTSDSKRDPRRPAEGSRPGCA